MIKIAIIQAGNAGFFPSFYANILDASEKRGDKCKLFSPNTGVNNKKKLCEQITWGTRFNWHLHNFLSRVTGLTDIFSVVSTCDLINKLKKYNPDIIHLHVINDQILNIPLLFKYFAKTNIPIIWTMHDCRAFTGGCSYPDEKHCSNWIYGCIDCPINGYKSDKIYLLREKYHLLPNNLIIVTPSRWLRHFVEKSFFKNKPIYVLYNGVDISVFRTPQNTPLQDAKLINTKKIILGVSIYWEHRKGLSFFSELADLLDDSYKIVLVGTISKEEQANISDKILCIGRTSNVNELSAWYQSANVFVNPTLSDNFPTTNIESLASGTPIVTFNTGGSPEAIDEGTGIVVEQGNIKALVDAIKEICDKPQKYSKSNCVYRSNMFSLDQFEKYVNLYHSLYEKSHSDSI